HTETLLLPALVTTKSCAPSPLKSATATDIGSVPVAKVRGARNVPSPLPSSTETALELMSATTRSRTPSPLKSPMATPYGPVPAGASIRGKNDTVSPPAGPEDADRNSRIPATMHESHANLKY